MKRRNVVQGILGITGIASIAGMYSWQVEPFWVEFVRVKMPIQNLPSDLEGKTLMQISDVHVGKRFNFEYIVESFVKAKQFDPDFVVYTGDYITMHQDEVPFKELKEVFKSAVKGKLGTIAILGNHDYGKNWSQAGVADNISEVLTERGITVLRNEQTKLTGLNFIGLDDYWGLNFNPDAILSRHDKTEPSIVLSHNPDVCDLDVWHNYNGWILSGHTHGGQCRPPFLPPPILPVKNKKYTAGKILLPDERILYINRALGHMYQVRFNVRPEISIFTLQKA